MYRRSRKNRLLVMFLFIAMLVFSQIYVNAHEGSDIKNRTIIVDSEKASSIAPNANTVCGSLTYHDMKSRGMGTLIRKSDSALLVSLGACYQCKNCYLVFVSQGEPGAGSIGTYGVGTFDYQINTNGAVLRTNNIGYTSSSTLSGYRFSYN